MGVDRNWLVNLLHEELRSLEAERAKSLALDLADKLMAECDISPRIKQAASPPEAVQEAARRGFHGGKR